MSAQLTLCRDDAMKIIKRWLKVVANDIDALQCKRIDRGSQYWDGRDDSAQFRMVDVDGEACAICNIRLRQQEVLQDVVKSHGGLHASDEISISDLSALRFLVFGQDDPERMSFLFQLIGSPVEKP